MPLVARTLDVEVRPLRLARAIADRPGFALLWSGTGGRSYLACDPIDTSEGLDPEPRLDRAPDSALLARAPRWIGVLPYEAFRQMERPAWTRRPDTRPPPHVVRPRWHRYDAVAEIDNHGVMVVGESLAAVERLRALLSKGSRAVPRRALFTGFSEEPPREHAIRIAAALELISSGEIYQVNLSRKLEFSVSGGPLDWLEALARGAPAAYSIALDWDVLQVAGCSPELFLRLEPDGRLLTCPIKGTRPRGIDATADRALSIELDLDPKENAELSMIVDVERNDLGRVARVGTVRVLGHPSIQTHRTIHHRVASIGACLADGATREALLEAMLPSGSVTGAPKVRAMEVIATLEPHRRGLYTGAFGLLRHNGGLELGMAIRTMTARAGVGHYCVGGGIVHDSDPAREVQETHWKALQLAGPMSSSRRFAAPAIASQNLACSRARR